MKLENQVVSLELAQKLKELGVKQESLFFYCGGHTYYHDNDEGDFEECPMKDELQHEEYCESASMTMEFAIPAYTVAELGDMLRKRDIYLIPVSIEGFWTGIDTKKQKPVQLGSVEELTEADARAKMLIYLLENKLITL